MPFYAVARGYHPGIYKSWEECKQEVHGFTASRYKKFPTQEEAQKFIRDINNGVTTNQIRQASSTANLGSVSAMSTSSLAMARKVVKRKLSLVDETLKKLETKIPKLDQDSSAKDPNRLTIEKGSIVVYTDGACSNNGNSHAKAGYGVFWGDGHPDNISAALKGTPTNNRAEYTAIIVAMKQGILRNHGRLTIRTDSRLLIDSLTKWRVSWKRNNWKKKGGRPVLNVDLLIELDSLLSKIDVTFEHVNSHIGIYGNEMADELAREGAKLSVKNP